MVSAILPFSTDCDRLARPRCAHAHDCTAPCHTHRCRICASLSRGVWSNVAGNNVVGKIDAWSTRICRYGNKKLRGFETCWHMRLGSGLFGVSLVQLRMAEVMSLGCSHCGGSPPRCKQQHGVTTVAQKHPCHLKVRSSYLKTTAAPTWTWIPTSRSSCRVARAWASAPPP